MILTGCVAFARHVGPTRVEAELLPQCWEQVNNCIGVSPSYYMPTSYQCSYLRDINYVAVSLAQLSDSAKECSGIVCFVHSSNFDT